MSFEQLIQYFPPPRKVGRQSVGEAREESRPVSAPVIRAIPIEMQRDENPATLRKQERLAKIEGPRRVLVELAREEIWRAVCSKRQLQEVMVQFWMNHFNIYALKGPDRWLLTPFERDTIRPHALGKFEGLLVATSLSPAMLFYRDNWRSSAPRVSYVETLEHRKLLNTGEEYESEASMWGQPFGGPFRRAMWNRWMRRGRLRAKKGNESRKMNENYSRELMELHTLGVNGGYTQQYVIEVARCLTGWTIRRRPAEKELP